MTLLTQLKSKVLDVLAPHGWATLLKKHGLDISVPLHKLANELAQVLPINRTIHGFEEFALGGYRAVEPGHPGRSLLYHALASANVNPGGSAPQALPTLEQLDIVENYIYSRAEARLDVFNDPVIAIFAYQYRDKDHTTHRQHADLTFSRTGVARVGNEPRHYDPALRGFDPRPTQNDRGFRVLAARYGVFIAERRPQTPNGSVMRGVAIDGALTFLFPIHKLFSGDECLFMRRDDGALEPIRVPKLAYVERHINEKLAKIHLPQNGQNPGYVMPMSKPKFALTKAPYVRDSKTDRKLVKKKPVGASLLIEPIPGALVQTVTQRVQGVEELARFTVPKPATINGRMNRYWSTLELPATGNSRSAPEYANIRQEIVQDGAKTKMVDLNLASPVEFDHKVQNGGYEAAHFVDNTCDGVLTIKPLKGIELPVHCAYSLVTAVDYFPRVDQMEIEEWIEKRQGRSIGLSDPEKQFPQGGPQPMSDGRFEWSLATGELLATHQLPNCTLPHPLNASGKAFSIADPSNYTATAVVGSIASSGCIAAVKNGVRAISWLPDGAADVFAPGWDVSQHLLHNQNMYVAYGLGSPFPEDAKLCAALNSFWPAVAPDSARTYGYRPPKANPFVPFSSDRLLPTSIPLLDGELGYHRDHPRVQNQEVAERRGWDGDFGPFFVTVGDKRFVDASNPMRADQTRAALDNLVGFNGLDQVDTELFKQRMEALGWCRKHFDQAKWWLITCERVMDWGGWDSLVLPKASPQLQDEGMIFVFADVELGQDHGTPPLRRRFLVKNTFEIQLANLHDFTNLPVLMQGNEQPLALYRINAESFQRKE